MDSIGEQIIIDKAEYETLLEFAAAAIRTDVAIPCYVGGCDSCIRCKTIEILEREEVV